MAKKDKNIMKIAVGTKYSQKLEYLSEVLDEIGVSAKVVPHKVSSGVSDQPTSEEETLKGSINRAKIALSMCPTANLGLGMEVGYHPNKNGKYEMFCCTSIVDKNNYVKSCLSSKFLLPEYHQKILKKGKYLGDHVGDYKKEVDHPVINYIRDMVTHRKPMIAESVRNALLSYLEMIAE